MNGLSTDEHEQMSWRDSVARRRLPAWTPAVAVLLILVVDATSESRRWPVPVLGLLDEPAHLLTAALVLGTLPARLLDGRWAWALVGAVAIDVDHLPMYTFARSLADDGRPPSHSLATALTLLVLAAAVPFLRAPLSGLSLGVCLHLVRDLATGPGVPLFWPVSDESLRAPYWAYVVVLGVAAALSTRRLHRRRRGRA